MPVANIKSDKQRRVRKITGRIAVSGGTPSIGAGAGFTISDEGAGKVKITFGRAGRSLLGFNAIPIEATEATAHLCKVLAQSTSSVTVGVYVADNTDGALVDNVGFFFEATLKDVG